MKKALKSQGPSNGGFFEYKSEPGFENPHLVISVDNLRLSMEAVRKEGGEVLGEPMDIPGVGKYASFKDTEGNRVGMLHNPRTK